MWRRYIIIFNSVRDLVGNTPILRANNFSPKMNLFAKLESFNPTGSVKDRIALKMIEDALLNGTINHDTIIIEPSSGNTGIGLAAICGSMGMRVIIVMPDSMSIERRNLIKIYGAEVILTPGVLGMEGAVLEAKRLTKVYENSFCPSQFDNLSNPLAHYQTIGKEIFEALEGKVDVLIAGIGTGGTISGAGKYLKERNESIKIIGVEPKKSAFITTGKKGKHSIEGIGAGFIPKNLDINLIDKVVAVEDIKAINTAKEFIKKEGIPVGISAGASLYAAVNIDIDTNNKNIVVILPDSADRYYSTLLFD